MLDLRLSILVPVAERRRSALQTTPIAIMLPMLSSLRRTEAEPMTDPPVACLLSEPGLRERRRTVLADFKAARLEVRDLADGYAFRFAPSSQQLTALAELIDLERRCCPFLRFRLIAEPAGGPLWLELTGPAGTREMLAHELGLIDDPPPAELFPEQLRARSYLERKGTLATTEALRGQVAEAFRLIE